MDQLSYRRHRFPPIIQHAIWSAPPRQARGTPADVQAAQETGLRTEITDDRQAELLRIRFPVLDDLKPVPLPRMAISGVRWSCRLGGAISDRRRHGLAFRKMPLHVGGVGFQLIGDVP